MLFISLFASLSFGMLAVKSCLRKDSKLISESETTIGSTFEIFNWEKDPEPKKLRMDMATMINRNDEDQQMKLLQFIKDRFEQMASYVWTKFYPIFDPIASHISNVRITGRFMYGYFLGTMFGQYAYMWLINRDVNSCDLFKALFQNFCLLCVVLYFR